MLGTLKTKCPWEHNEIQFASSLCELVALGVPSKDDCVNLTQSMDISYNKLRELFERASSTWKTSKKLNCPPPTGGKVVIS
jgi:hypothetical protein